MGESTRRSKTEPSRPRLIVAPGSRVAEEHLLAEVERAHAEALYDPGLLARPLRVVVPSTRLREHVSMELVRRASGSQLGVRVQTHRRLALELLDEAGEPPPRGEPILPLLVRRALARELELCRPLEGLREADGVVTAGVEDFLDAGFEEVHADALLELLEARTPHGPHGMAARAQALVRVACEVVRELRRLGLAHRSSVLRRARERLEQEGEARLPTRRLWLYGFADVTGVTFDWLRALLLHLDATFVVTRPLDPAGTGRCEKAFTRSMVERLEPLAEVEAARATPRAPEMSALEASGATAEARAVAERIRGRLDEGVAPERIGVVARTLGGLDTALAVQLERLAIPYSAPGSRYAAGASARRIAAALTVLREREGADAERWLDACDAEEAHDARRRLALRRFGAVRLGDVPRASAADLAPLQRQAQRTLERLERWPDSATLAAQLDLLEELWIEDLGWRGREEHEAAFDVVAELRETLPPDLQLSFHEFVDLLAEALRSTGAVARGGSGAGVQVLSVMEARGCTFEHLFVPCLNRGVFPRPVPDDPLLPDEARRVLRTLLPDFPVKGRARDEERHLFAELLTSSPSVTLSWQGADEEGRTRSASPFLLRIHAASDAAVAPAVATARPRPAHEQLAEVALQRAAPDFSRWLAVALEEARGSLCDGDPCSAEQLAASRWSVLRELDAGRSPGPPSRLGPYFGFTGSRGAEAGPGGRPPGITFLERLGSCPWRALLQRELGLDERPDALAELPSVDARQRGMVVHRVLERIANEFLQPASCTLDAVLERTPAEVPWPDPEAFERLLEQEARAVLEGTGRSFGHLVPVLMERARAPLEVVRRLEWGGGTRSPAVLGAEVDGELQIADRAGEQRTIRFRADRVDAAQTGVCATDYKTGRSISEAVGEAKRREHFQASMAARRDLQAAAYREALRARGVADPRARFLFLRPDLDDGRREFGLEPDEGRETFLAACRDLLEAWDAGSFFPRLVEPDRDQEPAACERCEVRLACLRGDSGQRARLRRWASEAGARPRPLRRAEAALLALWHPVARDAATREPPPPREGGRA